jgi:hypothetical protein
MITEQQQADRLEFLEKHQIPIKDLAVDQFYHEHLADDVDWGNDYEPVKCLILEKTETEILVLLVYNEELSEERKSRIKELALKAKTDPNYEPEIEDPDFCDENTILYDIEDGKIMSDLVGEIIMTPLDITYSLK